MAITISKLKKRKSKNIIKIIYWAIIILLTFWLWNLTIPSIAIWYIWKKTKWDKRKKIIGTVFAVILFVLLTGLCFYFNKSYHSELIDSNTPIQASQTQSFHKEQIQKQSIPDKIESLADFENSQFCRDLKCNKEDSWQLRSGGIYHSYTEIFLGGDKYNYISVGIATENKQATEFELMYFGRELSGLKQSDLEIAYKLLNSIDSTRDINFVKNYIIKNIEKEIFQIKDVSPISWGLFNIYAGKIGQQTISIEKIK